VSWRVELGAVERTLAKLDPTVRRRVLAEVLELARDPRHPGALKLRDRQGLWRVRAGDWRIFYEIDDAGRTVSVALITHRADAYRPRRR
jgi:mRNA interferase RelE/StbE